MRENCQADVQVVLQSFTFFIPVLLLPILGCSISQLLCNKEQKFRVWYFLWFKVACIFQTKQVIQFNALQHVALD